MNLEEFLEKLRGQMFQNIRLLGVRLDAVEEVGSEKESGGIATHCHVTLEANYI